MSHAIYLSDGLLARLEPVLKERGLNAAEFVVATVDEALIRHEKRRALRPKEDRPKNPVGRPRLSAPERQFRDAVREIDGVYLSLENEYLSKPGVFQELYGVQLAIYRRAVAEKQFALVQWWTLNSPWQKKNPDDFIRLFESFDNTVTSNL